MWDVPVVQRTTSIISNRNLGAQAAVGCRSVRVGADESHSEGQESEHSTEAKANQKGGQLSAGIFYKGFEVMI